MTWPEKTQCHIHFSVRAIQHWLWFKSQLRPWAQSCSQSDLPILCIEVCCIFLTIVQSTSLHLHSHTTHTESWDKNTFSLSQPCATTWGYLWKCESKVPLVGMFFRIILCSVVLWRYNEPGCSDTDFSLLCSCKEPNVNQRLSQKRQGKNSRF